MAEVAGYDPSERRERYLRERDLKGRSKGVREASKSGSAPKAAPPADRQAARAAAAARIKSLNAKLTQLRAALAKLPASDEPSAAESKSKDKAYNERYYTENKTKIANDAKSEARSAPTKSTSSSPKPEARSADDIKAAIRSTLVELKSAIAKFKSL